MRIAIASGKGGAGKTTVASSLAVVWDAPCLLVDADVEAPNLHLFLSPCINHSEHVHLAVPELVKERCTACGACRDICSFKAIAKLGASISVFPDMCHGCGGCFLVCPENALAPGKRLLGEMESGTVLDGKHGFLMGRARIGEAMTPPQLRALQKRLEAMLLGQNESGSPQYKDAVIDAPPGVSCPAMTVGRDADIVLLVAEPTPFGLHDFALAHQAFAQLNKPIAVAANRSGMPGNNSGDNALRDYCRAEQLPILAELPFSREAAGHYASGGIAATLSAEWTQRFVALREALRVFAAPGGSHA